MFTNTRSVLKTTILSAVATVCLIGTVSAQSSSSGQHGDGRRTSKHAIHHRHAYGHAYGYAYGYGYPRYSSHYESVARGKAELIRSQAAANLLNAQAWTQAEDARARNMENNVVVLETRLQRRHINTVSRFGHLHAKAAERKSQQAQFVSVALANNIDPSQRAGLGVDELNPATGQLQWPLLLQGQHFARARQPVNEIFVMRAEFGKIHPDDYLPMRNWIERIKSELHKSVDTLPREDYAAAQEFLRRLTVELRISPQATMTPQHLVSK